MYGSTDMNALRISTSPVGGLRDVDLDEGEVGRLRNAVRAGGQMDLATRGHRSDPRGLGPPSIVTMRQMESLRGQLLVAGPDLLDPNFRRSVLLVGEHGDEGAMGVILNRPSPVSVADAVPPLADLVDDTDLVHVGGPVQPQAIVVLGDFRDPDEAAALVLGSIGFLPAEIESAADVGSLDRARVFAGYAGWGPGQLESEIAEESWIIEQALPEDVFTEDPDELWSAVLRRKGGAVRRARADAARPEQQLARAARSARYHADSVGRRCRRGHLPPGLRDGSMRVGSTTAGSSPPSRS